MRVRKETVWAVVISAALVTAGLILSCGDDDDGDGNGGVTCEQACERLEECEFIPGDFGEDVEECVEFCEDGLDEGGDVEDALTVLLECVMETDCEDIEDDCIREPFCEIVCDILVDCELIPSDACEKGWVEKCAAETPLEDLLCILYFAPDCEDIGVNCI